MPALAVMPTPSLYLAIYAPRRELLEVWPPRAGRSVQRFRCSGSCRLLQRDGQVAGAADAAASLDCALLDVDSGKLHSLLNRCLTADEPR